jgi:uncharacterized protein YqfA (UPF0365 family)
VPANMIFILAVVVVVLGSIGLVVVMMSFSRLWIRAFLSGTKIMMFDLIGMRLRGSNMKTIVEQCIVSSQAGFPVSCKDMERAFLQKVDIEKVTAAYIVSKEQQLDFSFMELVEAEREQRLEKMLDR